MSSSLSGQGQTEGRGSIAQQSDVISLGPYGAVRELPMLFAAAKRCRRMVVQNLVLAAVGASVAAVPAVAGWWPLWLVVALHEGSTVLVALNSLRALAVPRAHT